MALKLILPITTFPFFSYKLSSKSHSLRKHVIARMASSAKEVKPFRPPGTHVHQVTHSMAPEKIEIFASLENWAEENLLVHLTPVEKSWQPHDFLPDPGSEEFYEQIKGLRERSKELPDDYLVVLVGHMITEDALPTYLSMANTLDGTRDQTGSSLTPWAIWSRAWAAEENRHGDLLNKYLYLSGRVDMRQIDKTIQYLIGSGMDPKLENNPFLGFIYTSFQERATFINHGNAARLAKGHRDLKLAQICGTIAADEKRHETAYTKIMEKLFEIEPDYSVVSFAELMKKRVLMPSHLMFDGRDENIYGHLSTVVQRLGMYTVTDYADIIEALVAKWKVEKLTGLSGEGREAQDYVCGLPRKIRRSAERAQENAEKAPTVPFSWIFGRKA